MSISIFKRVALFKTYLDKAQLECKSYQVDGVEWCLNNELNGVTTPSGKVIRGGIIADEMGLGKTITMIGLCIANVMRKTLIVLPVILIEQWASQIYKTTGHRALIYHAGTKKNIDLSMLEKSIIVLTTYQTVASKNKKHLLHSVSWNRLVFDEAHHLRNYNTNVFQYCHALKSRIRWLMTGTPIQNRARDLYHLCSVLRIPESLVKENIEYVKQHFMLKRTKNDVGLRLPDVRYNVEHIEWINTKESNLAQGLHDQLGFCKTKKNAVVVVDEDDDVHDVYKNCGTIINAMVRREQGDLFRFISASKQSCVLPKLLEPMLDSFVEKGKLKSYDHEMITPSSKLDVVCRSILDKKDNQNGKLIFCSFHLEMETIHKNLTYGGMNVIIYGKKPPGSVSSGWKLNKNMNLNELNYDAVIIQIQTGCEGLNLQKYNEVYFVSPNWNPMIEEQAIGRCHRIGQVKPVFVNHFVMNGFASSSISSMDKFVMDTQLVKRKIIKTLIG